MRRTMLVAVTATGLWAQEPKKLTLSEDKWDFQFAPKIAEGLKALPAMPGMPMKPPVASMRVMPAMPGMPPMYIKGPWGPDLALQPRDRATEQAEREYSRGTNALDKRQWDEAVQRFSEVATIGRVKVDGALYWKAYALAKLGRNAEATATLSELAKVHPQSRWLNDAKALGVEIAQAAGKPISPEEESDNDIKLMAINALMHSDPERSIPLLENLLQTKSSPKLRERALFVLSQSDTPKAREIVVRAARGQFNPDLQMKALQSLGTFGGKQNRQILSEIYTSSNDVAVKRHILQAFMVAGDREPILAAAKSESTPELRRQAIQLLGAMGAGAQLSEMYGAESSAENRAYILQAMMASGNSAKLIEIAKSEQDPKLRARAIQFLGAMRSPQVAEALSSIYSGSSDQEVRSRILQAFFVQGDAKQLIEIARKETDPHLKKMAVQHLSHMKSKEATEYMLELLK